MTAGLNTTLARYAEVLVRVGLNLRAGQRLLIAEPFEMQGVSREASVLVDTVSEVARELGAADVAVIWGDEKRLRVAAERWPDREFDLILAAQAAVMRGYMECGDALLFLQTSHPRLMEGVPAARVARLRERCWQHYGTVAPDLVAARTNWTIAPAPTHTWAAAVFPEAAEDEALQRLWELVASACRASSLDVVETWRTHLDRLQSHRDALQKRRHRAVHFVGGGTDLVVNLARDHVWHTACLVTADGRRFVANLPTEEIFTAPDRSSARGTVRVGRAISYGGAVIDGMELEFVRGRVVKARAHRGEDLLRQVLATDRGACRLGEIALVPDRSNPLAKADRLFFHPLFDENALDHIALGDGYGFTVGPKGARELNHSLIHIDLPIAATATFR